MNPGQDPGWFADDWRFALTGEIEDLIRVLRHPLQAVLREHDGQPQVVIQLDQRVQHLLCGLGVKLRGGLVEHQHLGVQGEHGGDGYPLSLAAGQGRDLPPAQGGDVELVQHFLDAFPHGDLGEALVFHGESQFVLDYIYHGLRFWILEHKAHGLAHAPRLQGHGVESGHAEAAADRAAVKVGHQAVEAAQQGGFARSRAADDQDKGALLDLERHVAQRREGGGWVGIG